ncbi:HEAT repeat domain-containing protein [Synechococcus sp. PCC 7336]|uniref:HEAT repeat domain-containing protein n=1 Tax=Synechococcus sp. PCC 7336 TaxID=195250 RepID=UPI000346BD55|nr:HEAT repeat domain-containing protein [Synechococcus sp. PCC 7336]
MTESSVEEVAALLQSEDWGDRLKAVNQTRTLTGTDALKLLSQAAVDPHTRVRYAAISQIGTLKLDDPTAPLPLLRDRLLSDSEIDVRAAAAAAMGDLKQPEVLPDLLAACDRETEWLAVLSIIAALGELGDLAAFDRIQQATGDDNGLIRATAASALGDLGDPRGLDALIRLAAEEDWQIRHRACIALGKIGAGGARPTLETLADDDIEQVAQTARDILAQML